MCQRRSARARTDRSRKCRSARPRARVLTSTVCVVSSTDGETNVIRSCRERLAGIAHEPDRQSDLETRRLLHRHVHVDLEPGVVVERREHRRGASRDRPTRTGMSPTTPARRRDHAVVRQLGLLLSNLLVDRLELRLGRLLLREPPARSSCWLPAPTSSSVFARSACWRANVASASRAARSDSRLATAALQHAVVDLEQRRARAARDRRTSPESA